MATASTTLRGLVASSPLRRLARAPPDARPVRLDSRLAPRRVVVPPAAAPRRFAAIASPAPKVVTFVTGNQNKLKEVRAILGDEYADKFVLEAKKVDLPELQGEPEDIAKEKASLAAKDIGGPTLVEDTSLCYNALKGLPGPYVKWFLDKTGHEGLVNMLAAYEDKSAYAQCIFAYCEGPERRTRRLCREDGRRRRVRERTRGFRVGPRVSAGRVRTDVRGDGEGGEELHLAQVQGAREIPRVHRAVGDRGEVARAPRVGRDSSAEKKKNGAPRRAHPPPRRPAPSGPVAPRRAARVTPAGGVRTYLRAIDLVAFSRAFSSSRRGGVSRVVVSLARVEPRVDDGAERPTRRVRERRTPPTDWRRAVRCRTPPHRAGR